MLNIIYYCVTTCKYFRKMLCFPYELFPNTLNTPTSLPPTLQHIMDTKKGNTVAITLFKYKNRIGYSKYEAQKV